MSRTLPSKDRLTICFAHVAYRMGERFELRNTGMRWFEVRSLDELEKRIGEAARRTLHMFAADIMGEFLNHHIISRIYALTRFKLSIRRLNTQRQALTGWCRGPSDMSMVLRHREFP